MFKLNNWIQPSVVDTCQQDLITRASGFIRTSNVKIGGFDLRLKMEFKIKRAIKKKNEIELGGEEVQKRVCVGKWILVILIPWSELSSIVQHTHH